MRLAVVGGGIAGLAAAYEAERLAREKGIELEVVLYEASDRLGGKIWTIRESGYVVEAGADAVIRSKPWALELANELGLGDEMLGTLPASTPALIAARGAVGPLPAGLNLVAPSDLAALARTPLLSTAGKLRALGDLVLPRRRGGDEALGDFVRRRLGRELWENVAAPLVGGIYGGPAEALSTEAAFPQLLELERRHRSLILGSRQVLRERAARNGGSSLFASFDGGLSTLVEAVASRLAITEVRLETSVESLATLEAHAVVLAVPAFAAATLLAGEAPVAAAALRRIPYADADTATLAFPEAGVPELEGHGLLYAGGEGRGIRGFTWVDRKWPGRVPTGKRLVRAFLADVARGGSDEELVVLAHARLRELLGSAPEPERWWVSRWPRGLPQYTLGHRGLVERIERGLGGMPWLRLAGAGYRGIGIPDVVRSGREAARALLG
jgi:protoporphyrinogen/coproporphyrinogen III oxidase